MFSTFDLRLLLYVIRLAGWLKHCNLSLSTSDTLKLRCGLSLPLPCDITRLGLLRPPVTGAVQGGYTVADIPIAVPVH